MVNAIRNKNFDRNRLFWQAALTIGCFLINFTMANVASFFGWSLYLDSVGTILAGALGGPIPGMLVGVLYNLLNSFANPIKLFFGVISVFIGLIAYGFSYKGWLKKIRGAVLFCLSVTLIGGTLGTFMAWFLYGGLGEDTSAPFVQALMKIGMSNSAAMFVIDLLIELADKTIVTLIAFLFLKFYPKKLYDKFALSYMYDRSKEDIELFKRNNHKFYTKVSVKTKLLIVIVLSGILVGMSSVTISVMYYTNSMSEQIYERAEDSADILATTVNGNDIEDYFVGEKEDQFCSTLADIREQKTRNRRMKNAFVFRMTDKGMQYIFDSSPEYQLGDYENSYTIEKEYYDEFLHGKKVYPNIWNGEYGWVCTAYSPILNSDKDVVAYAGVDYDVEDFISNIWTLSIQICTVIFIMIIFIVIISVYYSKKAIVNPINRLVEQTKEFSEMDPDLWMESESWEHRKQIRSGDEIETLYNTQYQIEKYTAEKVKQIKQNEAKLKQSEELKKNNLALEKAIREVEKANSAKTEFLARMSHDMRTPMNGILGLTYLSEDENDSAVLKENISKINESGKYLLGLINDTLDYQKIESGKLILEPEEVYPKELISSVVDMVITTAKNKGIDFKFKNNNALLDICINVDPMRIRQILINLLSNAIKFTPAGGTVELGINILDRYPNSVHALVTVTDTGIGMSKDFLENGIFKPFSQEHNEVVAQYAGTGLGLSIAKKLVELMGATITVESELGVGTKFSVDIVLECLEKDEHNKKTDSYKLAIEKAMEGIKGKKILLAEDHPLNAEITKKLIAKAGGTIIWTKDGKECLDTFIASVPHEYDAILMDIRMPIMDGLEATKAIRDCNRNDAKSIPIIAMTANAYPEDVRASIDAGMNEHLGKPIVPQNLYETLAFFIGQNK